MAAYSVVDYTTATGTLLAVAALMETKLETLDSTNNVLYHIDILELSGGTYQGVILYKG
mgnify:CR=1